jgi:RNA polymerase sigma-70 factor (ECF subfamily)
VTDRAERDAQLIKRFLAGEVQSFDELMDAHEDRVFAVCLRMLRDREAALDATQETFITVFRKVGTFAGKSAFSTWLYRVAVNTCYDALRRQKRRAAGAMPEHHDPPDVGAEDEILAAEIRPDIESALRKVPIEFRSVLVLVDLEGMGQHDAAEVLGVAAGTVKSRLFRGRRLLAAELGNQSAPPGPPSDEEPHNA